MQCMHINALDFFCGLTATMNGFIDLLWDGDITRIPRDWDSADDVFTRNVMDTALYYGIEHFVYPYDVFEYRDTVGKNPIIRKRCALYVKTGSGIYEHILAAVGPYRVLQPRPSVTCQKTLQSHGKRGDLLPRVYLNGGIILIGDSYDPASVATFKEVPIAT